MVRTRHPLTVNSARPPGPVPSPPGFLFLRFSSRNCRFASIRRAIHFVPLSAYIITSVSKQASKEPHLVCFVSPATFRLVVVIGLLEIASPESLLGSDSLSSLPPCGKDNNEWRLDFALRLFAP